MSVTVSLQGIQLNHTAQAFRVGFTVEELLLYNAPHSPGFQSRLYSRGIAVLPISTTQLL